MVGLTVLLLLLVSILSTDACSCHRDRWASPHRLCSEDIVLRGEAQDQRLENVSRFSEYQNKNVVYLLEKIVFTVKVQWIFKGLDKIKNISQDHNTSYVEIYTPPDGGTCGIYLQLQQSYVVSASVSRWYSEAIIESLLCINWQSKWEEVPKPYKEFFPVLETCKCVAAANINCAGRFFLLSSIVLTVLNIE